MARKRCVLGLDSIDASAAAWRRRHAVNAREYVLNRFKTVFGIDLRTLALFRIAAALMVIADLGSRARDLTAHYSDAGILPRMALLQLSNGWRPSLHLLSGSAAIQAVLMLIAALIAIAMLLGYRTRLATVASWLLLISLQARNPLLVQGGDNLLLLLLFWGMFLPLGARFSIDCALDRALAQAPHHYFSAATLALLVQVMSVYFFSALLKTAPQWWPDGTAVAYALHIDHLATPLAVWMRQFGLALQALTYYVWLLELIGPILIFSPLFFPWLRLTLLGMFVTMHVGFLLCLQIGLFPLVSIAALSVFTPSWVWERLGRRLHDPRRSGMRIYYDDACEFCQKTCLILRTLLMLGNVPILKAQETASIHRDMVAHDSWVVVDHDGTRYLRWAGVALVFRRSPIFSLVGRLICARWFARTGDRIYQAVANHRGALGRLSAVALPYRTTQVQTVLGVNVVVAALLTMVLWINLATLPFAARSVPASITGLARTLALTQQWNMFAPAPASHEGWFVVRGQTAQGLVVDVLRNTRGNVDFERPAVLADEFPNYRWRKYLMRLAFELDAGYRTLYAQYLCRTQVSGAGFDEKLEKVQVYFVHEHIQHDERDGWTRTVKRHLLKDHECAAVMATPVLRSLAGG